MTDPKRYQFISDGGHGWLRVPRNELAPGERAHYSAYSYTDKNNYLYLEEDGDAPLFMQRHNISSDQLDYIYHDGESSIRQLPHLP